MDTPETRAEGPRGRRWRPIALSAALALAGLSAIVYLSVTAGSHPPAPGARPAAVAAPAGTAAVSAPAGNGAARTGADGTGAAPAPSLAPAAKARVARWNAGHGAALTSVSGSLGAASMAGAVGHFTEMRLACVRLAAAVGAARAQPPIPDAALQRWYKIALSELAQAAANCQAAITSKPAGDEDLAAHVNTALLNLARSQFAAGAKDLYRASASVKTLGQG